MGICVRIELVKVFFAIEVNYIWNRSSSVSISIWTIMIIVLGIVFCINLCSLDICELFASNYHPISVVFFEFICEFCILDTMWHILISVASRAFSSSTLFGVSEFHMCFRVFIEPLSKAFTMPADCVFASVSIIQQRALCIASEKRRHPETQS